MPENDPKPITEEDNMVDEQDKILTEKRLRWSLERTRLAKERTFAAWLRTGLAATIAGLGLVKLLPDMRPDWLGDALGLLLVLSGTVIFILGFKTYYTVLKALEKEGFEGLPVKSMGVLTFCFILIAAAAFVLILLH